MIIITDHDHPKSMHALGNAVDLGLRNCCNSIRCKDIAQGLSIKLFGVTSLKVYGLLRKSDQ